MDRIGATAGKVWGILKAQGPSTATKIVKAAKTEEVLTHQALGWLAREGKLRIDRSKKSITYTLME